MNPYYIGFFSELEKKYLQTIKRVIIWGRPLYSHTQSYIDYCWKKCFDNLGISTYVFSDENYPKNFDFANSLFFTEQTENLYILRMRLCLLGNRFVTS